MTRFSEDTAGQTKGWINVLDFPQWGIHQEGVAPSQVLRMEWRYDTLGVTKAISQGLFHKYQEEKGISFDDQSQDLANLKCTDLDLRIIMIKILMVSGFQKDVMDLICHGFIQTVLKSEGQITMISQRQLMENRVGAQQI